ncbi:hypothetical protein BDB01DRAFT_850855 [Pilobolus umbonatus]|nr:hypothetical protein BDB01DRAFT_850855 [Pilobolus umbonatus]
MKDYLPTPVTPASDFPHFHTMEDKKDNSFGAFSVMKPDSHQLLSPPYPQPQQQQPPSQSPKEEHTTTTTEPKPYPCPQCRQTFSRPHNLKSHLTTHSTERPYHCEVCNHHFRRHHDLKRHQKLHTGERPYVCENCYRSFARLDALNRHKRAEGGTACGAVHQHQQEQQKKKTRSSDNLNATYHSLDKNATSPSTTVSSSEGGVSSTRPIIPTLRLSIPHAVSHLHPKDGYPHTLPIPTSHSPQQQLLPSPSALSTLPITNGNNLNPIFKPSLPITPLSPPGHQPSPRKSPLYHSSQPWSPYPRYHERRTLPRISSPPPHANTEYERILKENGELKRDLDQLRLMASKEASEYKSKLHDLALENKVLRSLLQPGKENSDKSYMNQDQEKMSGHSRSPVI